MKELYIEGLATHSIPESCVAARKGGGEALTGARTGTVLSRENRHFGTPTSLSEAEGSTAGGATGEPSDRSRAVVDPSHVRKLPAREPGEPRGAGR